MADQITQRNRRKGAHPQLPTMQLSKDRAHDDFAPLAQLAIRPTVGAAFKSKRDNHASRRVPIVLLNTRKSLGYNRALMMQWARVALALVVIFSIAYVLITPDPTDDVYGVLRPNHPDIAHKVLAVSLWESQIPVTVLFHLFLLPGRTRHLASFELLDVISVCRC
jgi:hypothetical protein